MKLLKLYFVTKENYNKGLYKGEELLLSNINKIHGQIRGGIDKYIWETEIESEYDSILYLTTKECVLKNKRKLWSIKTIEYLMKQGMNIHADNDRLLIEAIASNQLKVVKFLIENGGNIHSRKNMALRNVAATGQYKMTQFLIKQGANVNIFEGQPLRNAIHNDHLNIAKLLLKNGANINHLIPFPKLIRKIKHLIPFKLKYKLNLTKSDIKTSNLNQYLSWIKRNIT